MTDWIKCSDRYPKLGQECLVWFANSPEPYMDLWLFDNSNLFFCDDPDAKLKRPKDCVTHWAEAPAPPVD
jgi:hypothetical protein